MSGKEKKEDPITITEEAAENIRKIAKENNFKDRALRIVVFPGGCSGMQYGLDFAKEKEDNEIEFEQQGIKIYIDKNNLDFIQGLRIDFLKDKNGFKFDNPNYKHSCDCGKDSC